ncbi:MMPL family transporter [Streptomyces sp. NPDC058469]|uniref:MMPL family transporter n=1 Tax=Streptomyces sp. NPDC058469 TaxID=3346514 RepID=UPI0036678BFF
MFAKDPTIGATGFSFAIGVLLDAFVVRLMLVPATMALIGARIRSQPRWFETRVPDPDIEGRHLEELVHTGKEARDQALSSRRVTRPRSFRAVSTRSPICSAEPTAWNVSSLAA